MSVHVSAPWTDDQVAGLVAWQGSPFVHPFTCPADGRNGSQHHSDRRILVPTNLGWECEMCPYMQDWAHNFMFEPVSDPFKSGDNQQEKTDG